MSDFHHHHLLLRKRFRRDRKKTISASIQSTMIKRPLDEWNPSTDLFPVKRRAISATTSTTGCENDHSTPSAVKDELNVTTIPSPPRRTVTRFETSLPNEILYEIFKYLSQSDLFYAFFNLNQRLNDVLLPFTSHIDCSKLSLRQFEHIRNHLIYGQALTINNQYAIKQVFRIDLNRSRFPRLERLALIDPTIDELNLVFAKLKQLTVRTLNIRIQRPSSSNHETTYKNCLQHHLFGPTPLPTLTSISIEMHHNDYLQFLTPNDISLQYEHLLELTIPLRSFDSLLLLLEHLPNLRKFTVKLFADPTPVNVPLTGKPPNNLLDFELHVTGHELNFDRFVLLMTSRLRASKLERLAYFNRTTTDQTYFNGHRWEIFLENSFPRLKKLEFCFDMPIDENVTPVGPILQSFASFDHPWSIGHLIWRPHSNKTRLKLFTLPYAFDTLKLSTSNSRLPAEHLQQFQAVRKLVLDATHGTMKDIYQQLVELLNQHCRKATSLQIQNIVLANTESIAVKRACRHIKHLIINECDGRLVPLLFAIATDIRTLTVTGPLLLKYFLKSPPTDATFLRRIRTLELNCMQIDRQNRLNRLLSDLPRLFPSLEHLTMDINPKLFVELKSIERMLDVLAHLISLKVQRTNKYLLEKTVQDDRRTRTFFEVHSNRLRRCDTYEIVCKESQLEFWL